MTALLAFVGASIGAWLASRLAAIRSYEDRVWGRKAEAYSHILGAFADIRDWYGVYLAEEMLDRESSASQDAERQKIVVDAKRLLAGTIARECWLLNARVQETVDRFNAETSKRFESWFEALDNSQAEAKIAQREIEELAREELKKPSFWVALPHFRPKKNLKPKVKPLHESIDA